MMRELFLASFWQCEIFSHFRPKSKDDLSLTVNFPFAIKIETQADQLASLFLRSN